MSESIEYKEAKDAHSSDDKFIENANAAAVELSAITLRSLLLLNGGATVAMLGFVATVSSSENSKGLVLSEIVMTLQMYSFGAALAVLATGLAYLVMFFQVAEVQSRLRFWEHPYTKQAANSAALRRTHLVFHVLAVVVSVLSLGLFCVATFQTGSIVAVAVG